MLHARSCSMSSLLFYYDLILSTVEVYHQLSHNDVKQFENTHKRPFVPTHTEACPLLPPEMSQVSPMKKPYDDTIACDYVVCTLTEKEPPKTGNGRGSQPTGILRIVLDIFLFEVIFFLLFYFISDIFSYQTFSEVVPHTTGRGKNNKVEASLMN